MDSSKDQYPTRPLINPIELGALNIKPACAEGAIPNKKKLVEISRNMLALLAKLNFHKFLLVSEYVDNVFDIRYEFDIMILKKASGRG